MAKGEFDGLLWTFGNHEPVTMYRRIGKKSTGGVEGGSRWLEKWHNWYDSEDCAKIMEKFGLNILHSRFYKGMGWDFEKEDFPRVKGFVENCHKHGVKVLGYVQYGTLYYEVMKEEIPDLDEWAALDSQGRKFIYYMNSYYRWMPCVNNPDWRAYIEKILKIGIEEGGFDGILFDNCMASPCACPRCRKLFVEYLEATRKPSEFGLRSFDHVIPPPEPATAEPELKDPIVMEWLRFREKSNYEALSRFYKFAKKLKPGIIMSGNTSTIHRHNSFYEMGLGSAAQRDCFDIVCSQSGNEIGVKDGMVVNRLREYLRGEAIGAKIFALSDGDAGRESLRAETSSGEADPADADAWLKASGSAIQAADLMEAAVFGGIPFDRIIMAPPRGGTVNGKLQERRGKVLKTFNAIRTRHGELIYGTPCEPVRALYSEFSQKLSRKAIDALFGVEETLMRGHVPYGIAIADGKGLRHIDGCEILVACGQSCLSDKDVEALKAFASAGGTLIVDKTTGDCDEDNRQRESNPFVDFEKAVLVPELRTPVVDGNWTLLARRPENADELLRAVNISFDAPFEIDAPETCFIRVMGCGNGKAIHLIDYTGEGIEHASLRLKKAAESISFVKFGLPELEELRAGNDGKLEIPSFAAWAAIVVE